MRLILVIIVWIVIVGGLSLYMHSRVEKHVSTEVTFEQAKGEYSLELITTSKLVPDPFSLSTAQMSEPASLIVKVNGTEVLRTSAPIESQSRIKIPSVKNLIDGQNEIYVEANPPVDQTNAVFAVRVRIILNNRIVTERTLWSDPGMKIADTINLEISNSEQNAKSK
jgi:hypothetical protein